MEHHHGQWTGIKDVAVGALAGGLIGGLAVPKHRAIAATLLAAVGAFKGMVLALMTMFLKEGEPSSQDEILVYYTDRIAAVRSFLSPTSGSTACCADEVPRHEFRQKPHITRAPAIM
jgi:hypothetical protein